MVRNYSKIKDIKQFGRVLPLIFFFNIFFTNPIASQFYSIGTDPANVRWRYIEAGDFKVIYPEDLDSLARRYAFLLESSKNAIIAPFKLKIKPIDVIIHPYSVNSNGMVTWAPRRIELLSRPPASGSYAQNWEKQLVAHELRHVGQISKFERGIFKPLNWLLGEQATGMGVGLYMGKWLLEGDAVVAETELSASGRGRDASHLMYFKAAFLDGDFRNWHKWKLGSFKNYVPDEYSVGYLMNSFMRFNSQSRDYIGNVADYMVDRFYLPGSRTAGYKRYTGNSLDDNFHKMRDFMTSIWTREDSLRRPYTVPIMWPVKKEDFASYTYPTVSGQACIIALKRDLNAPERLVNIDSTGKEKIIRYMGYLTSPPRLIHGKLYWTESVRSTRWELESFSDIFEYDPSMGKTRRMTKNKSYYHPFISGDNTFIVTSYPLNGSSCILFLNPEDLSVISSIEAPEGWQFKESVLFRGEIYATAVTEKGLGLYRYDSISKTWICEIADQRQQIEDLRVSENLICFSSDLNGVGNIYAYDPAIKAVWQLSNARFGAGMYSYAEDGSKLYYADFGKNGYDPVYMEKDSLMWRMVSMDKPYRYGIADVLSLQAGFPVDTVEIDRSIVSGYESVHYSKIRNLFRIHSWAPVFYDIDKIREMSFEDIRSVITPGIVVYSQNSLSTANAMLGYSYYNGFNSGHFKFSYKGFYPVLETDIKVNTKDKERILLEKDDDGKIFQMIDTVKNSPYMEFYARSYVPINLNNGGGWSHALVPSVSWKYTNDAFYTDKKGFRNYQSFTAAIRYYRILNMGLRDIFPKYGFGINTQYTSSPLTGNNFGSLFYSSIYGYLPGLIENHGIRLYAAYQKQYNAGKRYFFSNAIAVPAGYGSRTSEEAVYLSAEYAMPLYTGDISVGKVLYLKRIQLNPFVQYMYSSGTKLKENMLSAGSDLLFDFNFAGIGFPLSAGVRAAFTQENKSHFELLFKTSL